MDTAKPVEEIEAISRTKEALTRLRNLYLWQDMSDDEYVSQRTVLERELRALEGGKSTVLAPNLERAGQLLTDMPALWQHLGVTDEQRQDFPREVFRRIEIHGRSIVDVEPNPQYAPLFAYLVSRQGVNGVGPTPVTPTSYYSDRRMIAV